MSAAAATSTSLWPGPDGLDEDQVEAGGVEHGRGRGRRRGQPAGVAARRHRADEHAVVAGVCLHPDAVAEQRAAGDRARRVDGDHRHGPAGARGPRAISAATSVDLPAPGRPGDADQMRAPGLRIEPPQRGLGDRRAVLDRGQQPGERQPVARDRGVGQLGRPARAPHRPPR